VTDTILAQWVAELGAWAPHAAVFV
jgi:hypothetical protein